MQGKTKNPTQLKPAVFQSFDWSKTEQETVSCIKSSHGTSHQHEEGELQSLLKTCQLDAFGLLAYSRVVYTLIIRNPQRIVIIKQSVRGV